MSTYQLYKKYKETSEIKKIYEQINDLRSLLENYNEYLPDSKEKLQEINTKAKELYQQYRNFNNFDISSCILFNEINISCLLILLNKTYIITIFF